MPFLDTRTNDADHNVIAQLQQRMEALLTEMDARADDYAKARQVREFLGDRRKAILGRCFVAIQVNDPEASATAAEHRARHSAAYNTEMKQLAKDAGAAETEIVHNELLRTRLDVCRSLLSLEKEKLARL